jgi:hypothetical protein
VTTQGTFANKIHKLLQYKTAMAKSLVVATYFHTYHVGKLFVVPFQGVLLGLLE